jgi:hypothetical protein
MERGLEAGLGTTTVALADSKGSHMTGCSGIRIKVLVLHLTMVVAAAQSVLEAGVEAMAHRELPDNRLKVSNPDKEGLSMVHQNWAPFTWALVAAVNLMEWQG